MSNIFQKAISWIEGEGKILVTDVETFWAGISGKVSTVPGIAMQVDQDVVAAVPGVGPAVSVAIAAGITALQNLNTDVSNAVKAVGNTPAQVVAQLQGLSAAADTLQAQAAPFIQAGAADASAIDAALVQSVAALTGVTAAAPTS
jgi:hypothetical protein